MHTRQLPAKAGNCGYARPLSASKKEKKDHRTMNEILDEIEIKNNHKKFSKLSLMTSLITLGLFSYLFSSIPKTIKASEGLPEPPMIIVIATQVFCLVGIIITSLSFMKKEPSTWFKWVGAILNILLFLLIAGSAIFARVV